MNGKLRLSAFLGVVLFGALIAIADVSQSSSQNLMGDAHSFDKAPKAFRNSKASLVIDHVQPDGTLAIRLTNTSGTPMRVAPVDGFTLTMIIRPLDKGKLGVKKGVALRPAGAPPVTVILQPSETVQGEALCIFPYSAENTSDGLYVGRVRYHDGLYNEVKKKGSANSEVGVVDSSPFLIRIKNHKIDGVFARKEL